MPGQHKLTLHIHLHNNNTNLCQSISLIVSNTCFNCSDRSILIIDEVSWKPSCVKFVSSLYCFLWAAHAIWVSNTHLTYFSNWIHFTLQSSQMTTDNLFLDDVNWQKSKISPYLLHCTCNLVYFRRWHKQDILKYIVCNFNNL